MPSFFSWVNLITDFFNLQFLHEQKHKVHLSKTMWRIFHFRFHLVLLNFIFLLNKMQELFGFKTSQFFSKLKY